MNSLLTFDAILRVCGKSSCTHGTDFYKQGKVRRLSFAKSEQKFHAIVLGTSQYEVTASIDDNEIWATCTCPIYDSNNYVDDYCKHIAAVLISILNTDQTTLTQSSSSDVTSRDKQFAQSVLTIFNRSTPSFSNALPTLNRAEGKQPLDVEYICQATVHSSHAHMITLDMKLGPKRLYVLQKIKDFLHTVERGAPFTFSKNFTYDPQDHVFKQPDWAIIQLLLEAIRNENAYREAFGNSFPTSYSVRNDRLLYIPPHMWDRLVPLLGEEVNVTFQHGLYSHPKVEIIQGEPPLRAELSKPASTYYQLDFHNLDRIEVMEKYGYALAEGKLHQMKPAQLKRLAELKTSLHYAPNKQVRMEAEEFEPQLNTMIRGLKSVGSVSIARQITERIVDVPLRAKLYLDRIHDTLIAGLEFVYDDMSINPLDSHKVVAEPNRILMRDIEQEERLMGYLEKAGFRRDEGRLWLEDEDAVYEFLYQTLPELEKLMTVYATSEFKPLINRSVTTPKVSVDWDEKLQWLEVKFDLPGMAEPDIRHILRNVVEKRKYVRLPDGSFLSLQNDGFRELERVMRDMDIRKTEIKGSRMQLSVARGLQLLAGSESSRSLKLGKSFRQLLANLSNPDHLDFNIPAEPGDMMRDYQKYGFQWMKTLSHYRFGGILADDMGLGKTVQAIAYIVSELPNIHSTGAPVLIVCPASLIYNWRNEIIKFAPKLRAEVVAGAKQERTELLNSLAEKDVIITSYPLLRRDMDLYSDVTFHTLILDEAQAIKNHATQTAQTVKEIQAAQRFALTGTPVENSLEELWSIFDAVFPELFTGRKAFNELRRDEVARRVRPFILRRMKQDVLKELPDKIETLQTSELTIEQKKLYMAYLAKLQKETSEQLSREGFQKSRMRILAGLTRLRQLCCHPSLFIEDYTGDSGKLEQLMDIVEEALSSGKRILLFSQFTSMLSIIRKELEKRGESCFYLDGQTPAAERVELCRRFNEGEQDLFLISLKAGGTGLNLTGADTVILYDLWWNPAVEQQATDRAHRIGQTNVVQVIRLITQGTVEEKMYELQQKKKDLIDQVIQPGDEALSSLSEADLREILSI